MSKQPAAIIDKDEFAITGSIAILDTTNAERTFVCEKPQSITVTICNERVSMLLDTYATNITDKPIFCSLAGATATQGTPDCSRARHHR